MRKNINVILLHGWGCSKKTMEPIANMLKNTYTVHNLDLPGFGDNILEQSYDMEKYILWLENYINSYSLTNIVLVGYSFGGKIAFFMKLKYPKIIVISIAPSAFKNPFNLITFLKKKLYKIGKKLNIKFLKNIKGSKDYQNAQGILRITFLNIVNTYLQNKDLKRIKGALIIGFKNDTAINIKMLRRIHRKNKTIILNEYNGNHYSYLDYLLEIYQDINNYLGENNVLY